MILIYTGNGKGKTSACVGQAMRAIGQGMRVVFLQYMKRPGVCGEQQPLRAFHGDDFCAGGRGFLTEPDQFPTHREAALQVTEMAREKAPLCDMLVLDEALYALRSAILTEAELRSLMDICRESDTHLVLSGRTLPEWLHNAADLVTEMTERKHPHAQGTPAMRGIEF